MCFTESCGILAHVAKRTVVIAGCEIRNRRKVRTGQGTVVGNANPA